MLLIFDCCYAGNLIPRDERSYYSSRSFELIAACGRSATTSLPGPASFTSALIWALKSLVADRNRFTTLELQTKVMSCPSFPKKQLVTGGEINEPCDQRLILAPVSRTADRASPASITTTGSNDGQFQRSLEYYLDLRLWFESQPNENEISNLAKKHKRLMVDKQIGAHRIDWHGLKNVELARHEREERVVVERAARKWMDIARLGNKLGTGRKPTSQAPDTNGEGTSNGGITSTGATIGTYTRQSSISDESIIGSTSHKVPREPNGSAIAPTPRNRTLAKYVQHHHDLGLKLLEDVDGNQPLAFHNETKGNAKVARSTIAHFVQDTHPLLRVVIMASLTACAWYALPWRLFNVFTIK